MAGVKEESRIPNILYRQVSLILSLISVVSIIIGAFVYLTSPTKDNDTAIQLQEQRIATQDKTIETLTKTQQNDTQEVKTAITSLNKEVNDLKIYISNLSTIIDERIPKE
jgi:uncharacterized membrane protein YvbJ